MKKGKKLLSLMLALLLVSGFSRLRAEAAGTVTVKELTPPKYDDVMDFSEGMAAVKLDEKWGFIDTTGREVIPPCYADASSFSGGLAAVCTGAYPDAKWGFIDATGQEVTPQKYDQVKDCSEGLAAVCMEISSDEKWGFIDTAGQEVISPQYNAVGNFSNGLAAVLTGSYPNAKWGFIDTAGREVTPQKYDQVKDCSEGLAAVCTGKYSDRKWGFVDTAGREVVPPKYDYVRDFSEGLAVVEQNGKWGFVDQTGAEVIPLGYEFTAPFVNGFSRIAQNGKYGFIDRTGAIVVSPNYDSVMDFSEGMAAVCVGKSSDQRWGFIDTTGRAVVEPKYTAAADFSEGMAVVHMHSQVIDGPISSGFVDKTGAEVIPIKGDYYMESFSHGLALVRNGTFFGEYGFMDKSGKEAVPLIYQEARAFSEGFAAVGVGEPHGRADKWGFLAVGVSTEPEKPSPAPTPTPEPMAFIDVDAGSYYYDAVWWAVENEITAGTSATSFSPHSGCTRAQAVTFLWKAAGSPAPQSANVGFTDVKAGSYYEQAVCWAVENKITSGTGGGKFSPNDTCTRAQAVTFLYRTAGSPSVDAAASFGDMASGAYYVNAAAWAAQNGITSGTGNSKFSPNDTCTRAQIVTFLYRGAQ